jgi:hypothetical protein
MRRWFVFLGITLIISACSALAGDSNSNIAQTTGSSAEEEALVAWDRDSLHIVFQADVTGGDQEGLFIANNRVPLCTLYGDGRIVWTTDDEDQVLFDILTDQQIIDFVTDLTIVERFFTFKSGADTLLPTGEVPYTDILVLQVNGLSHQSDSFGDWTEDYFDRILSKCQTLGKQPRIFQPSEGWFSVALVDYNATLPSLSWDAEASNLSLFDILDMPQNSIWLENNLVLPIWTAIQDNDGRVQFNESGEDFIVVLRVPGVTDDAPPPPTDENPEMSAEATDEAIVNTFAIFIEKYSHRMVFDGKHIQQTEN